MIDDYKDRFDHPYLFALVPAAAVFFSMAVVVSGIGSDFVAGFLALYASVMLLLCALGYATLFVLALSTQYLRQWRIRRSSID